MPSSLSTFQTLPLHIAEAIADYCIRNNRLYDANIVDYEHNSQTWGAFYDVSNLWRVLALRYYCKSLYVRLVGKPYKNISFTDLPHSIKVHKQFYSYAKSLNISTGDLILKQYSVIAKLYNEIWPKDATFTSASSLVIATTLNPIECTTVDNNVENEKLFRLLQRIRISMPNLQEVRVIRTTDVDYNPGHSANTTEPKLDSLFMDILKRFYKLEVRKWPALLDGRDAQFLNGSLITSLSYSIRNDMDCFAIVLQRVGPTLESLEIEKFPLESIKSLVFNSNGSPIVYSQLKRLYICVWYGSSKTAPRIDLIAAPFPSLRYLKWEGEYPFENDSLFRGSHDTLEYLHLRTGRTTLDMLETYDMALRSRYTRLRHLFVRVDPYPTMESGRDHLLKFGVSLISQATQTFSTNGKYPWQHVLDTFSTCPYAENLQVLSLAGTGLCLVETLALIKLLPTMSDFTCRFSGPGTSTHDWKDESVLDRLHSEYYPLSRHLRYWKVEESFLQVDQVAIAAIKLAALCPRITFVAVPRHKFDGYQAKLKEAAESRGYCNYREKIQRLISDKRPRALVTLKAAMLEEDLSWQ